MLEYGFWYDVAQYMNEVGRGKFTDSEIAENAKEYEIEWKITLDNHELSYVIQALVDELNTQNDEKSNEFLTEMSRDILNKMWKTEI